MSKYTVKFYTGNYRERQEAANADGAICYVEQHFNAGGGNYSLVVVGENSSKKSQEWGQDYSYAIALEFEIKNKGIAIGGLDGRGDDNVRHTDMPAILLEPLFCDNPDHAQIIRSAVGQDALAVLLAQSIWKHFPKGGLVAFSIGHKGKRSNPNDRGASVLGGGMEADYAEAVLLKAKALLESPAEQLA